MESLTLNLGNLTGAKEINLVVAAKITWPTTQAGGTNFLKYANKPGVMPSPPPYMQVRRQTEAGLMSLTTESFRYLTNGQ